MVSVFDLISDEDGAHWLVMEYVDGTTLAELVRERGPLVPREAAALLGQVADALVAAHDAGIVHRDVKPANVLVDAAGNAKLTDFGIARVSADPALTQTGILTGSPAYLSPEVARGGRGDGAVDVWSLGATAYFVLTGRPAYDSSGENVLSTLYRIAHEDPPRLPGAGPLAPLFEGTLVRDPVGRWSMGRVRELLRQVAADDDPQGLRPVPVPDPADGPADGPGTEVIGDVPPAGPTPPAGTPAAAARHPRGSRLPLVLVLAGLAVMVALAVVLAVAMRDRGGGASTSSGTGPGAAASSSRTPAGPTAAGMKAFIRDYVATVSEDPAKSWRMLTPTFQRASGGWDAYSAYWDGATNGRVLDISADPGTMTVRYQVHFDHHRNGPGPTVLELVYEGGRYRIDNETTKGFVPATG